MDAHITQQQLHEQLGNMSMGATTAAALIVWIETHASFIGVMVSLCALSLTGCFYAISIYYRHKEYKLKEWQAKQEVEKHHSSE